MIAGWEFSIGIVTEEIDKKNLNPPSLQFSVSLIKPFSVKHLSKTLTNIWFWSTVAKGLISIQSRASHCSSRRYFSAPAPIAIDCSTSPKCTRYVSQRVLCLGVKSGKGSLFLYRNTRLLTVTSHIEFLKLTVWAHWQQRYKMIDFTCLQDTCQLTLSPAVWADVRGLVKNN